MKQKKTSILLWLLVCFGLLQTALFAQETETEKEKPSETPPAVSTVTDSTVSGGVNYQPVRKANDKLQDPFKSPFEIQKEEREQRRLSGGLPDREHRLPYSLSELDLRGIYYHAGTGYRAIFRIGSEYKWWPAGTKFRDADLVDITDGAAIFKQYTADDESQVRDVVRELHRGEE